MTSGGVKHVAWSASAYYLAKAAISSGRPHGTLSVQMSALNEPLLTPNSSKTTHTARHAAIRYAVASALALVGIVIMALAVWTLAQPFDGAAIAPAEPNARRIQWYDGIDSVCVMHPGDAVGEFAWALYNEASGCDATGEFSPHRHALILTRCVATLLSPSTITIHLTLIQLPMQCDGTRYESNKD